MPVNPEVNSSLEQRRHELCERIETLRQKSSWEHPVSLLAVTKGHPASKIRTLFQLGQRRFGENYAQEMLAKAEELAGLPIEWVFIGHLQSNKIKKIVSRASEIQTVASLKHAQAIARHARDLGKTPFPIMLEANADLEASKNGVPISDIPALYQQISEACPELRIKGVMAIPSRQHQEGTTDVPAVYHKLRQLADHVGDRQLSLGMSNDIEAAIQAGTDLVRIGTALMGPRPQKTRQTP